MMIVGYGALVLPVASIVWGTRLVLHAGTHRALPRVFFLPIVLALASIYSASHVPPSGWTHSFGLGRAVRRYRPWRGSERAADGGAAGAEADRGGGVPRRGGDADACRGHQHRGIPGDAAVPRLRTAIDGRHDRRRLRGVGHRRRAAAVTVNAARIARGRPAPRRYDRYEDEDDFAYDAADDTQPVLLRRRQGFLSRMPLCGRATPRTISDPLDALQPELPRRPDAILDDDIEAPDDDRVRARISDAIRSRVRRPNPVTAATQARLASGDAARADRLHLSPALRMEPP
jgi:S-DNA-T family DNA segregation ATPase FtsK/SpoIIIE